MTSLGATPSSSGGGLPTDVFYICNAATPPPPRRRRLPDGFSCAKVLQEILDLIFRNKREHGGSGTHGLKWRIEEQIRGPNGPGTPQWDTHDSQIRNTIKGINDRIQKYKKYGCDDDNNDDSTGALPAEVYQWATVQPPAPGDWIGPEVANILGYRIYARDINNAANAARNAADGTVNFLGGVAKGFWEGGVFVVTIGGAVLKFIWDAGTGSWRMI